MFNEHEIGILKYYWIAFEFRKFIPEVHQIPLKNETKNSEIEFINGHELNYRCQIEIMDSF